MTHTLTIPGPPVAQGRLSTYGKRTVWSNARQLNEYRGRVQAAALSAGLGLLTGPVVVEAAFRLEKGKTVRRILPSVRPDLDHFQRALGDALSGIWWADDAQIVEWRSVKEYAEGQPHTYVAAWVAVQ